MTKTILGVALLLAVTCALAGKTTTLQVKIVASEAPAEIVLQREQVMQSLVFQKDADARVFRLSLPLPTPSALAAAKKTHELYRLVASWRDGKEQFYMKIDPRLPPTIDLKIYRNQTEFDNSALTDIDLLGSDIDSTIEKYCRARSFHRHYRARRLPYYYAALRSAKIWFDAATNLAKLPGSPFRMDEEIKEIMEGYESLAKKDPDFERRLRQFASSAYITAMLEQAKAAEYAFIGMIRGLAKDGKYGEAYDLNQRALSALSREDEQTRKAVQNWLKIDLDFLHKNEVFLARRIDGRV